MKKDETIYHVLERMGAFDDGDRTRFIDPLAEYMERVGMGPMELAKILRENPVLLANLMIK